MVATHCRPSGSLGTDQLPVNPIPGQGLVLTPTGGIGHGNIRGVIVYGHGWNEDVTTGGSVADLPVGGPFLLTNFVNDGWIVLCASYPEDNYCSPTAGSFFTKYMNSTGIALDFINDTGFGARYLNTWLLTWDHIVTYIHKTYGANIPIVAFGESWGGWHMTQVALNRSSTIAAWAIYIPVVVISDLTSTITIPYNWATINTTGADITTLQGIGNGSQGVLPFSCVGWSNPDTTAESYLIKPYADTASSGYYSGLMTEYPTATGHSGNAADITFYTGYFTGSVYDSYQSGHAYITGESTYVNGFRYVNISGSTGQAPSGTTSNNAFWTYVSTAPWTSTFCVDHLCPKAF